MLHFNLPFILILALILINYSSCKLNLFRPFSYVRQIESTKDPEENSKSINNLITNDISNPKKDQQLNESELNLTELKAREKENDKLKQQSVGSRITKAISRFVDEIEIELENQIESHLIQSKNKSLIKFENTNEVEINSNEIKDQIDNKTDHQTRSLNEDQISNPFNFEDDKNKLDNKKEESSNISVKINDLSFEHKSINDSLSELPLISDLSFKIPSTNSTKNSNDNRKIRSESNEIVLRELTGLSPGFRLFGSIIDFIVQIFDDFAEAMLTRSASLILNSFFDKMGQFLLGI